MNLWDLSQKKKLNWPVLLHSESPISSKTLSRKRIGWICLLSQMMNLPSVEPFTHRECMLPCPEAHQAQVFITAMDTTEVKVEVIVPYVYSISFIECATFLNHQNIYCLAWDPLKITGSVYNAVNGSTHISCFSNCCKFWDRIPSSFLP